MYQLYFDDKYFFLPNTLKLMITAKDIKRQWGLIVTYGKAKILNIKKIIASTKISCSNLKSLLNDVSFISILFLVNAR